MSKLIEEPPLIVLPSLARELGLNEAIVLQQLYWLGQRQADRWVQRSAAEWGVALRGCFSARTVERVLTSLRKQGAVEHEEVPGKPSRYRVTSARLAEAGANVADLPSPDSGGSASRVNGVTTEGKAEKIIKEHPELSEWMGHHHELTGDPVLRAGTKARAHIATMFGARRQEGYSLPDLKLATVGAFNDEFRRAGGHFGHESVLRPTKVAELVAKGKRLEREAGEQRTDWTAFDD